MAYSQKKQRRKSVKALRVILFAIILIFACYLFVTFFISQQRKSRATDNATIDLNLSLKFQGIVSEPEESNSMALKVIAVDGEGAVYDSVGTFTSDESGVWTGTATFEGVPGENYTLYIKGPRHLQKRICEETPVESTPGGYECDEGELALVEGDNDFDFTGVYLFAGDLPSQDGISNSTDIAYIYNNLGKTESDVLTKADLNLDGVIDTQDYSLITFALGIQSEDEEPEDEPNPTLTPTINPSITVTPTPTSGVGNGEAFELGPGGRWSSVALDSQGKAHYAWWSQENHAIRYIQCGATKSSCGSEEKVNTSTHYAYYPSIALSTSDKAFLVWEERPVDSDDFEVYFSRRDTGGWTTPAIISNDNRSELPQIVTTDGQTLHVIYQGHDTQTGRVLYYTKSTDAGTTWSNAENIGHGLHPKIALDANGKVRVAWTNTDPFALYYRYQLDNGSWSATTTVSSNNKEQMPDLSVDAQGTSHLVWSNLKANYQISYTTIGPSGVKGEIKNNLAPDLDFAMWPKLSSNAQGDVSIVFQGKETEDDVWNIYQVNKVSTNWQQVVAITQKNENQQTPDVHLRNTQGAMIYIDSENIAWALPFNL